MNGIPFKFGELRLLLAPRLTRNDVEYMAGITPALLQSRKECARLAWRSVEILFRCAEPNAPNLSVEDLFIELFCNPALASEIPAALGQAAASLSVANPGEEN